MIGKLGYSLPASLSLMLIACGGGPDIDKVKADFENPTGSVNNREAVMASNSGREGSGPATSVAGGGVPGFSLTATGKAVGLQKLNMRRAWEVRARTLRDYLNGSVSRQALTEQQFESSGCDDSPEAQAAYEELVNDLFKDAVNPLNGNKKVSGEASYKVDLSSCSGGALSGSAEITIKIEAETSGEESGRFAFTVEYSLVEACELNTEAMACLDGSLIMEAEAISEGANNFGRLTFTSAWELSGTWNDEGKPHEGTLKGGLRTLFEGDGDQGQVKIEYLNYVNVDGEEWSYVWTFEADNDSVSWECRGKDGSVSCEITETSASCMGENGSEAFSWTAEDEAALGDDWYE